MFFVVAHGWNCGNATAILKTDGFLQVLTICDFLSKYVRTFLFTFPCPLPSHVLPGNNVFISMYCALGVFSVDIFSVETCILNILLFSTGLLRFVTVCWLSLLRFVRRNKMKVLRMGLMIWTPSSACWNKLLCQWIWPNDSMSMPMSMPCQCQCVWQVRI